MIRHLFFFYCVFNINFFNLKGHQHIPSDTGEFISSHGYKNETHKVRTKDGYHLTLHRITGKQNDTQSNESKPVVLVGHGIFGSSAVFVLGGPKQGLGYTLSDGGYDVWLANFRGNKYSQMSDEYPTSSNEFWDFSWHEMGQYDLPAMIEYILSETKVDKIFYIGYSQGTTVYFVFSSLHSEFANKHLKAAVALAPVVHLKTARVNPVMKAAFQIAKRFSENLRALPFVKGDALAYNVARDHKLVENIVNFFCNKKIPLDFACKQLLSSLDGFDEKQTNKSLLPIIYKHIPDGTSSKQLMHYAQIFESGKFEEYNEGLFNQILLQLFRRDPTYHLWKCSVNVALFYSKSDWISTINGVRQLSADLQSKEVFEVDYKNFNHVDFIFGNDAKKLVYDEVLSYMQKFL